MRTSSIRSLATPAALALIVVVAPGNVWASGVTARCAPSVAATWQVSGEGAEVPPPPEGASASVRAAWEALMTHDGEYYAYAQYTAVLDRHGVVQPYQRIREAEGRHIAALTRQLEQRGVTVPANPYLGKVEAPDNLKAAALAWAQGERDNVAMYDRLIAQVGDDRQMVKVLTNLRRASLENHLPAFELAAKGDGTLP